MSPLVESFIAHFGEMGSRWGINRTVGQVYALLFVSEAPLNADDIGEALGVSRSNISISLKELEAWQIVRLTRVPGDRRPARVLLDAGRCLGHLPCRSGRASPA